MVPAAPPLSVHGFLVVHGAQEAQGLPVNLQDDRQMVAVGAFKDILTFRLTSSAFTNAQMCLQLSQGTGEPYFFSEWAHLEKKKKVIR